MQVDRHTECAAARQRFERLRQCFARCVDDLAGDDALARWLRDRLGRAASSDDLRRLRQPLLAALRRDRIDGEDRRCDFQRRVHGLAPNDFADSGFADTSHRV